MQQFSLFYHAPPARRKEYRRAVILSPAEYKTVAGPLSVSSVRPTIVYDPADERMLPGRMDSKTA